MGQEGIPIGIGRRWQPRGRDGIQRHGTSRCRRWIGNGCGGFQGLGAFRGDILQVWQRVVVVVAATATVVAMVGDCLGVVLPRGKGKRGGRGGQ